MKTAAKPLRNPRAAARPIARGELWTVNFEPQTHREEPGKAGRPALVIQTDALNQSGHGSTIVIPGTSQTGVKDESELFPLRVRLTADASTGLRQTTDLLIDQVRAVSNRRLLSRLGAVDPAALTRAEQALRWLTGE